MVECFTLCNTACITCLWCSLLFSFCFPKIIHKLEKTRSSEFCIQRMKCQENMSKILDRCKSRDYSKSSSQSEESDYCRNQRRKYEKGTKSPNQKCVKKLSKDGINEMGESGKNICKCRNCLGYEYGCQNIGRPDAKVTSFRKNQYDLNDNSQRKYRLYAKLTKQADNSKEKLLHLKYKRHESNQECVNSASSPNLSQCNSRSNRRPCDNCTKN